MMKQLHRALLALIGSVAFGTAAVAAGASTLPPSVIVATNGSATIIPLDAKLESRLLADPTAKPLDKGVVMFVANGKAYMIEDHMMPSGQMMIASLLKDYFPPQGGG
jgi:hypothetical protein